MALSYPRQVQTTDINGLTSFPSEDHNGNLVGCRVSQEALKDDFHNDFDGHRSQIEEVASQKHSAGEFEEDGRILVCAGDVQKF